MQNDNGDDSNDDGKSYGGDDELGGIGKEAGVGGGDFFG